MSDDLLPPQNLEAEQGVLAALLRGTEAVHEIFEILTSADFYVDRHALLFEALKTQYDRGAAFDALTTAEELHRLGSFERADGDRVILDVMDSTPHAAMARYHAEIVREKAGTRRLIEAHDAALRACYNPSLTLAERLEISERTIFAVGDLSAAGSRPAAEFAREALDLIARRRNGEYTGVPTGLDDLDATTDGLPDGSLVVLAARPSMGKAQPLDANVLTPDGFVPMGSLQVGASVIGADGKPSRVAGVYPQGELAVYRVTTTDGGSTECCDEHLWFTQTRNERRRGIAGSVKPLSLIRQSLTRSGSGSPNHAIPVCGTAEFTSGPALRLHPYAMGLLLGDGSFSGTIRFTNPEPDVQSALASVLPTSDELRINANGLDCRVCRAQRNNEPSETYAALAHYGLVGHDSTTKFIPSEYLSASPEDRTSLLRGLVDSDGFVATPSGTSVEFSTSSWRLAEDMAYLARSLGGIVSVHVRQPAYTFRGEHRIGSESHRMVLRFPNGLVPVSSRKHLAKWKPSTNRYHRAIASVEFVGYKPCQCIAVDAPDHLYVTDDFLVTHNTALALNIAEHAAYRCAVSTLFLSLEMSGSELGERLLVSGSGVSGAKVRTGGGLSTTDDHKIGQAYERIRDSGRLWIDDNAARSVAQIAAVARRHKARHAIGLVIVDYLQLIDPGTDGPRKSSRQEQVAAISRRLKVLAKELSLPVLVLSQLNRLAEAREDHRPRMSDLRESGAIEQDADLVLLLHRPDYYDPNDAPGTAELIVAKNRHGGTGTVHLAFLKDRARFGLIDPRPADLDPEEF